MTHHKSKKKKREALNRDVEAQILESMRSHPDPRVRLIVAVKDCLDGLVKDSVPPPPPRSDEDWSEVG